jgi:hypothetical protein
VINADNHDQVPTEESDLPKEEVSLEVLDSTEIASEQVEESQTDVETTVETETEDQPLIPVEDLEKSLTQPLENPLPASTMEPDLRPEESLRTLEDKRSKFLEDKEDLEKHRELLSDEIEKYVSVQEDLNQWINARKESFAWKLTEILRGHEKQLAADEAKVRDFSANEPVLDTEFGAKTRRWIMKLIGIPALILLGIFLVMELIRGNSEIVDVPDPSNPAATIQVLEFDRWLLENLGLTHLQVTFMLAMIMLSVFTGALFAHSRRSSEFRQLVAEEAQLTKVMEQAVHSIKSERERVDSLHPQVPQILELLSLGLHSPWAIDPKYLAFEGILPDASKLPESLDVSVPTEKSSHRVFPQLVFRALNQIQQPGWREAAFENAIQQLSESAGFGAPDGALRELDQDQRRSGKRQMLISLDDKETVLVQIGEKMVKEFAAVVQAKVLPFAQPDVISLRPDVLSNLELSDDLVGTSEEDVSPWEQRLSEIAGAGSPWAPGTFSARGQMAARHEKKPDSVFIATDRATQYAHKEVNSFKEVYSGTRPFEVSIRVDLSEWCHPEELAIFQDYQPSEDELREREARESKQSTSDVEESHSFDGEEVAF